MESPNAGTSKKIAPPLWKCWTMLTGHIETPELSETRALLLKAADGIFRSSSVRITTRVQLRQNLKSLTMRPNHAATTAQCLLCCVLFCSHRLSLFWKSNAPSLFGYAFTAAKGIVSCVLVSLQLGEGLMLGPERAASRRIGNL